MSKKFYIFELPELLFDGIEPFKLDQSTFQQEPERESDSENDQDSDNSDIEDDNNTTSSNTNANSKPAPETHFSLVETKYTNEDVEKSFEQWQWENMAHMTGSPYVYYSSNAKDLVPEGKVFGIYKSWFDLNGLFSEPVTQLRNLPKTGKSCVIMIGSGHFAAAIIGHKRHHHKTNISNPLANVNVLNSKTFHRYTTRRKQGGAQSAKDNQTGKANSAGSTIRRSQEKLLQEEIRELLADWAPELNNCYRIYFRAPGRSNKGIISGYPNAPLKSNDPRLVKIPFATKRPTIDECKTAWLQLTRAVVCDPPQYEIKKPNLNAESTTNPNPELDRQAQVEAQTEQPKQPELTEDEELTIKIVDMIKRSKFPALQNLLNGQWDFNLEPNRKYTAFPTPLALSVHLNKPGIAENLLVKGANPLVKVNGSTLGESAKDKKVMEALQMARKKLGEDKWDWSKTGIHKGMSREELLAKETKEKLQIKEENERLHKELEEQDHKDKMERLINKHGSGRLVGGLYEASRGLSEEDLKMVERERRARAAEARLARFK